MSHIWPGHNALLRAMYREILRGIHKIKPCIPVVGSDPAHKSALVQTELRKASKWPQAYGDNLRTELKIRAEESFRKEHRWLDGRSLLPRLEAGQLLIELLGQIHREPTSVQLWESAVEFLVRMRQDELQKCQWRQKYLQNKEKVDDIRERDLPLLTVRRLRHKRLRKTHKKVVFLDLSASERRKFIKSEMAASRDSAGFVVRNYIKKLQLEGTLPNPYRLPYVPASLTRQTVHMPKLDKLLPLSTSRRVLEAAYDHDYIEAILKPEVEYRINMLEHIDRIGRVISEKGPRKIRIKSTNAGAMTAHYLSLPSLNNRYMRQLGNDITRLMRTVRKNFIWNLEELAVVSEKKYSGGYGVRGSRGFTVNEIMWPRHYYEELANQEAEWEMLLEVEKLKQARGEAFLEKREVRAKLNQVAALHFASWREPLQETTRALKNELTMMYAKYAIKSNSPIWLKRRKHQRSMDRQFKRMVVRYRELLSDLEKNRVFMHSELYRSTVGAGSSDYSAMLASQQHLAEGDRPGLPESSLRGRGRTLGAYVRESGFRGYFMGNKFAKRFGF